MTVRKDPAWMLMSGLVARGCAVGCLLLALGCNGCGGDPPPAGPSFAQMIADAKKIENADFRATKLVEIARKQMDSKDTTGAENTLTEALRSAKEITDPGMKTAACAKIAAAYMDAKKPLGVTRAIDEADAAASAIEDPTTKAKAFASIAATESKLGDVKAAAARLKKTIELLSKIENPQQRVRAMLEVAQAFNEMGKTEDADRLLGEALDAAKSIEDKRQQAETIADVAAKMQVLKKDAAKATFEAALAAADTIETPENKAYAYVKIGERMYQSGFQKTGLEAIAKGETFSADIKDGSVLKGFTDEVERIRVRMEK